MTIVCVGETSMGPNEISFGLCEFIRKQIHKLLISFIALAKLCGLISDIRIAFVLKHPHYE